MSFIGKNIRKIRTLKKLSQADFADSFNLARASVGAYEEGRADPKIDTIISIARKYGISIDLLITRELTLNDLVHFDTLHDQYSKKEEHAVITPADGISLVQARNYIDYIVRHQKNDFIDSLPKVLIPGYSSKKNRLFEMNGSEMEYNQQGLHHGDFLITRTCKLNEDNKHLINKVIVVISESDIVSRRLYSQSKDLLALRTDDPNYDEIQISRSEILELWEVVGVISEYVNPPKLIEEKVLELERRINKLESKP